MNSDALSYAGTALPRSSEPAPWQGDAIDKHPRFRRTAEYLKRKAPAGQLAGRQHIDPLELGGLLPWMMLIDVLPQEDGGLRYYVRLVGTGIVDIQGSDSTGKFADEVMADPRRSEVIAGYDQIVATREPQYRKGVVAAPGREHIVFHRVAFPLARDGTHVDMLLFVFARD